MSLIRPVAVPAAAASGALYVSGPDDTGFYNGPTYPGGPADKVGASLTDGSGITIQSNTTYENYRNLGGFGEIGLPSSPVHDVTFRNCLWEMDGRNSGALLLRLDGAALFEYCTVRPTGLSDNTVSPSGNLGYQYSVLADGTPAAPGTYNTFQSGTGEVRFQNCDFWGFANCGKTSLSTETNPLIFDSCWVHNARLNDQGWDDHTDGLGCPSGGTASFVTITKCRIEDGNADTNGLAYQNTGGGNWSDFTITDNLFGGFGLFVAILNGTYPTIDPAPRITFTDNTFSTEHNCILGPCYDVGFATASGSLWRRNRWKVPAGAAWGNVANDGKYWIPNATNRVGNDDSPYVSDTDFTG